MAASYVNLQNIFVAIYIYTKIHYLKIIIKISGWNYVPRGRGTKIHNNNLTCMASCVTLIIEENIATYIAMYAHLRVNIYKLLMGFVWFTKL